MSKPFTPHPREIPALLDGRQTMVVRAVKRGVGLARSPFGKPGDVLWLRESFIEMYPVVNGDIQYHDETGNEITPMCLYRADGNWPSWINEDGEMVDSPPWKSSTQMPQRLSRASFRVTSVTVKWVQCLNQDDWINLGCPREYLDPRNWFKPLWDADNAKSGSGWDMNPWCWVVGVERIKES